MTTDEALKRRREIEREVELRLMRLYGSEWRQAKEEIRAAITQAIEEERKAQHHRELVAAGVAVAAGVVILSAARRRAVVQRAEQIAISRFARVAAEAHAVTLERIAEAAGAGRADTLAVLRTKLPPGAVFGSETTRVKTEAAMRDIQATAKVMRRELPVQIARDISEKVDRALAAGADAGTVVEHATAGAARGMGRMSSWTRTESMRSYRSASALVMRENRVYLRGWRWVARADRHTCPACWAMHGTEHPETESMMAHVNCRCIAEPVVIGEPVASTGADEFASLPQETQKSILGPGRYGLYESGVRLGDMTRTVDSQQYGKSVVTDTIVGIRSRSKAR